MSNIVLDAFGRYENSRRSYYSSYHYSHKSRESRWTISFCNSWNFIMRFLCTTKRTRRKTLQGTVPQTQNSWEILNEKTESFLWTISNIHRAKNEKFSKFWNFLKKKLRIFHGHEKIEDILESLWKIENRGRYSEKFSKRKSSWSILREFWVLWNENLKICLNLRLWKRGQSSKCSHNLVSNVVRDFFLRVNKRV